MVRWLRNLFYRASLGDHSYRFLFEPGPPGEIVVLDCETTGLNVRTDEIVAVAAVIVKGHRIVTSRPFRAVVRPDKEPTPRSIKVHQLRARDVAEGRAMREVLPGLLRFIGGRPIGGRPEIGDRPAPAPEAVLCFSCTNGGATLPWSGQATAAKAGRMR